MDGDGYVKAYRFGFGVPREDSFDPEAELSLPHESAAAITTELQNRIVSLAEFRQMRANARNGSGEANQPDPDSEQREFRALQYRDLHTAIATAATTSNMFTHRLSAFWSNHFSLGPTSPQVRALAGLYETGALRPNMFGSFRDLLVAAELHPAMIFYLNLQASIGPASPAGQRSGKGFNENLGREILELHTLGIEANYSQADIVALSKLLTGWHVDMNDGTVEFARNRAEPGAKQLLGTAFGGDRPSAGDLHEAFTLIARHPSTARHIARKLSNHFFGPAETDAAAAIEETFNKTQGNLGEVYKTMVRHPAATAPLGRHARNDYVFLVSALRAGRLKPGSLELSSDLPGGPLRNPVTAGAMNRLTQKLWLAPSPKGWPDDPQFWLSPSVISARLRVIPALVRQYEDQDPVQFAEFALGPLMRDQTRQTIARASNRLLAIGLALASPEFQRS